MESVLRSGLVNVVSLDLETSWGAKSLQEALKQHYDARFQQKQMQEKEEKLLRLYANQQQRAFERVGKTSPSNSVLSTSSTASISVTNGSGQPGGKVRQMFDERRQKAGYDRSYPLEPLKVKSNGHVPNSKGTALSRSSAVTKTPSKTVVKTVVHKTTSFDNKPSSRTTKETIHIEYENGNKVNEIHSYVDKNDNSMYTKRKEEELEYLMNNHTVEDNAFLENEEFPDTGLIDIDEDAEEFAVPEIRKPMAVNNRNVNEGKKISSPSNRVKSTVARTNTITKNKPSSSQVSPNVNVYKTVIKQSPPPTLSSSVHSSATVVPRGTSTPKTMQASAKSTSGQKTQASINAQSARSTTNSNGRPTTRTPRGAPGAVARDDLEACKYCSRRFASDRLAVHENICARAGKKKRKEYDPIKHRLQGTEAEGYLRKARATKKPSQLKKSDWRQKHEEFIGAIRAAKMAQAHIAAGGNIRDLPPPPPSYNPDYVQCPHCGRRFNEAAAERHIPKCATYLHNKPSRLGPQKR